MKPTHAILKFIILMIAGCNETEQPKQTSGNPLFEGRWYADPEIALFEDQFWIFPTVSASHAGCVRLDAFSSKDLVKWEEYNSVIDTSIIEWADSAMWAPAIVKNQGKYFLFFSANDIQRPVSSW